MFGKKCFEFFIFEYRIRLKNRCFQQNYIYINIFAIVIVLRLITYAVHNFIINKKGETISMWHGLIQMC